jgi:hypothetical protein
MYVALLQFISFLKCINMDNYRFRKAFITLALIVVVIMLAVQCTKEGVNAPLIARNIVNPDSAVYASFYDTVLIDKRDVTADVNDIIRTNGVLSIINTNCASPACHGGGISPRLTSYAEIRALVVPGNPDASKLYQLVTTSDVVKAMPPVNYGVDLSITDKTKIYNWIKNGANERPGLVDFRPAAVSLLVNGCGSANCHNQATVGGAWARRNLIPVAPGDTVNFTFTEPSGTFRNYAQLKEPKLSQVWNAYKDSVRKFYADTLANASFRPYKTFSSPIVSPNVRGPLNSYDDLIFDAIYPKGRRSSGSAVHTNASGVRFYVFSDHLGANVAAASPSNARNPTSSLISRIDSTIVVASPRTKAFNFDHHGDMAYGDGGLSKGEIALIKAWYFADPNIPDIWKYGLDGTGIFKYRKSGNIIRK